MKNGIKAVVLAAGKGTRLRTEGVDLPKVLRQAAGRPLLGYVLEELSFLEKEDVVLVVGYEREKVLAAYPDKILNIHPSLIPSFCGAGYYGLRVHEAALAKGVKVTGATVHLVNEHYDEGRILAQKAVEVCEGDTPETLQRRVMEQAEWVILPQAAERLAQQLEQG